MAYIKKERLLAELLDMSVINKLQISRDIIEKFRRIVDSQPTADVEEVRHGEWIKQNGIYVCSECSYTCPYDVVGDNIEYWECLYCRRCGAKMGGKNENV